MIRRCAAFVAILLAVPASAQVVYVNAALEEGNDDGTSWSDAYQGALGLQNALLAAVPGDEIWVAQGIYIAAAGTPRTATFTLRSGIEIYGGFASGETTRNERNFEKNVVILSGDLALNDNVGSGGENAYHVVSGGAASATALLSGVTITAGFANSGEPNDRGAGLIVDAGASPRFEDCIVTGNVCTFGGGAAYVRNASPSFTRVQFESNQGGAFGGAFDIFSSGPATQVDFDNCFFTGNQAARAGAIEVFGAGADVTLTNAVIRNNSATGFGGAIYVDQGGSVDIVNATIVGNTTTGNTGGMHLTPLGSANVRNAIVFGNTDSDGTNSQISGAANVQYSNIDGGWGGAGGNNIDAEPQFVNQFAGALELRAGSPGVDAGNNAFVPVGTSTDAGGGPRFTDGPCTADSGAGTPPIVDMGAYERDPSIADCNENGTPDECEIASGAATDCDDNGVPDACDITAGAEDCNTNGIPDSCEVAAPFSVDSGVLSPFDSGAAQIVFIADAQPTTGDVIIDVTARADLEASFERVLVNFNGTSLGSIFQTATLCSETGDLDQVVIDAILWNDLIAGPGSATLTFTPNGAVGAECAGSFVQVVVNYIAAGSNDADADGVPDDCGKQLCVADITGPVGTPDGLVDFFDLIIVLSQWGPCPGCDGDLDDTGTVDFSDLLLALTGWGECP